MYILSILYLDSVYHLLSRGLQGRAPVVLTQLWVLYMWGMYGEYVYVACTSECIGYKCNNNMNHTRTVCVIQVAYEFNSQVHTIVSVVYAYHRRDYSGHTLRGLASLRVGHVHPHQHRRLVEYPRDLHTYIHIRTCIHKI